jgi:hypothetical protein
VLQPPSLGFTCRIALAVVSKPLHRRAQAYDAVSEAFLLQPWRGIAVSVHASGRSSPRMEAWQHRIPVENRSGKVYA